MADTVVRERVVVFDINTTVVPATHAPQASSLLLKLCSHSLALNRSFESPLGATP